MALTKMSSKYAIVTGGNAGLGLETAKALCGLGYHVTISARSEEKANEALSLIRAGNPSAAISFIAMELKDLTSVKQFADEYVRRGWPLHVLVNNAGIMNTPFEITSDGFEAQFQVNHLGHFLLTHYLLPVIVRSGGGRVVSLSSRAHMRWSRPLEMGEVRSTNPSTYDGWEAYGRSKLANILFVRSLARKFPFAGSGSVTFNAVHPGLVDTKLLNVAAGLRSQAIPVEEGVQTTLYLCTSKEVQGVSGKYFQDCQEATAPSQVSSWAQSDFEAEKLWQASLDFVGISDADYGHA
ncbi:SDR family oxidoreductase [archaeon]|nr:MAG: SDR family oxidoreductase [archaeon]